MSKVFVLGPCNCCESGNFTPWATFTQINADANGGTPSFPLIVFPPSTTGPIKWEGYEYPPQPTGLVDPFSPSGVISNELHATKKTFLFTGSLTRGGQAAVDTASLLKLYITTFAGNPLTWPNLAPQKMPLNLTTEAQQLTAVTTPITNGKVYVLSSGEPIFIAGFQLGEIYFMANGVSPGSPQGVYAIRAKVEVQANHNFVFQMDGYFNDSIASVGIAIST